MEPCDHFQLSKDCKISYADKTAIKFVMGKETLTIGTSFRIPDVTLACGTEGIDGFRYDGIVGMGRGKLSLLSQLNERVFAYCLPSRFGDDQLKSGIFLTGSEARIANDKIQTMPLLSNQEQGWLYYVALEGISVGETRLNVTTSDFTSTDDGTGGGMVIDSGATFTSLEGRVVDMIKEEFLMQTKLEKSEGYTPPYDVLDLCFMSPYDVNVIPKIVFHFKGADWELAKENYIYEDGSQGCLGIVGYGEDKTSVLGNMQQQNMMVIYDLDRNNLSFMPAKCSEL
ncbi:hypothetical protein L6452_08643 [Arctium lappa]|uniref:Uncharacterized protein n=1 Tax=Arctium lappa TaxID=4217 RepID=A0ACB9DHU8_ARCLA|nr:hypothetical protein L6452_08643 [Arctium lappa]